ncbi:Protein of unknown function [Butyrivibrio proteoclasticus]|uniref:DUF262 domain-containing protein n=1 Tax=Butyrivibrio proteoclasticus TaxID=43305 RepID=A0A1I5TNV0_9FIRM|nr:DUF262 domain-containing protein [Butyrivibrio proteoclasticus]SFP84715.1 Protein of unknown function [Butyrivibrio proteoclasticus]
MKANETTLIELIGVRKRTFSIPVYQRNYDWKADNCKQLFYDIQTIAESGKDHFLGTIVYIPDRSTATSPIFIVIDGQQRITSVMLFIKALHDSIDDPEVKEDIEDDYLRNSKSGGDYRLKLKPIESDQNVYEKLMMQNDFNEDSFTPAEKQTVIYRNYDLFKDLINESSVPAKELYEAVFKLEIVEIQLDKENPQEIFESLNSTGLDLSNADLLRNYLLMSLDYDQQQDLYKRYWIEIEHMLGNDQIEPFMTHYLILKKKSDSVSLEGKRAHINPGNLYKAYKMYLSDIEQKDGYLEELLADMKKYATYYQHFVNFDVSRNGVDKKHSEIFTQFNSPSIAITLMYFYDLLSAGKISLSEYEKSLDICISYLFRSRVSGHNVGPQFSALLIQYFERSKEVSFIDKVWDAFNSGKGKNAFPSDESFKKNLQSKDLYLALRASGMRYLLYKLEENLSKEVVREENATIEHIMPQTLSSEWRTYLAKQNDTAYDLYVHRLGNLTLTKENSKLSNNLFKDKLDEYSESNYKLTRQLTKYKEWTSKEIQLRSLKLSESSTEIWPLPRKYNDLISKDELREGMAYSLDDDLELFNGTKPATVMFMDEVFTVNSWMDVYINVHRRLYEIDSTPYTSYLFTDDNIKEQVLTDSEEGFAKTSKIGEHSYLNMTFRNTRRMLRKLRLFIDYFMDNTHSINKDLVEELVFELA